MFIRVDIGMDINLKLAFSCFIVCLVIGLVSANCATPTSPEYVTLVSTSKAVYVPGDILLYRCDPLDNYMVYGYVSRTCENDGGWTNTDRNCNEAIAVEPGSICGIVIGCVTILIVAIFLIVATVHKKKTEEEEKRIEEAGGPHIEHVHPDPEHQYHHFKQHTVIA